MANLLKQKPSILFNTIPFVNELTHPLFKKPYSVRHKLYKDLLIIIFPLLLLRRRKNSKGSISLRTFKALVMPFLQLQCTYNVIQCITMHYNGSKCITMNYNVLLKLLPKIMIPLKST